MTARILWALVVAGGFATHALAQDRAAPPPPGKQDRMAAYCGGVIDERMASMIGVIRQYGPSDALNKMIAADYGRKLRFVSYLESRGYYNDSYNASPVLASSEAAGRRDMRSYISLASSCHAACPAAANGAASPAADACAKTCAAKAMAAPVAARIQACTAAEAALPAAKSSVPPPGDLTRPAFP